ncbi:MAG: TraR/DksA C4-type zinc finger protein [Sphingomonadaceae bacterium]
MTSAESLRVRLWRRYAELGGDVQEIAADLRGPLDADFAEQATELEEQVALEALEEQKLAEMAAIRAALGRIAEGSYGICVNCGAEIPEARLRALPTAVRCVACAAEQGA